MAKTARARPPTETRLDEAALPLSTGAPPLGEDDGELPPEVGEPVVTVPLPPVGTTTVELAPEGTGTTTVGASVGTPGAGAVAVSVTPGAVGTAGVSTGRPGAVGTAGVSAGAPVVGTAVVAGGA
jgi:hypothetical protein